MALAAILNPINQKEALVFYYSRQDNRYNLAVNSPSLTGGHDSTYVDRNTSDGGVKLPPSDMVVTQYLSQIRVYGIARMPQTTTSPGHLVSVVTQLSPTRNPVDTPSNTLTQPGEYSAISVCGTNTEGYVSYLKVIEGDIHLISYVITKTKTSPRKKDVGAASYSKLASRMVDGNPWVLFQHRGEQDIYYYDLKRERTEKIDHTGACAKGSHFAITYGDSKPSLLFVYYRNISGRIARVFRSKNKWSPEEVVSNHAIDDDSAIAVVAHEDSIHAFFWSNGEIVHEVDDIPTEGDEGSDSASVAAI